MFPSQVYAPSCATPVAETHGELFFEPQNIRFSMVVVIFIQHDVFGGKQRRNALIRKKSKSRQAVFAPQQRISQTRHSLLCLPWLSLLLRANPATLPKLFFVLHKIYIGRRFPDFGAVRESPLLCIPMLFFYLHNISIGRYFPTDTELVFCSMLFKTEILNSESQRTNSVS